MDFVWKTRHISIPKEILRRRLFGTLGKNEIVIYVKEVEVPGAPCYQQEFDSEKLDIYRQEMTNKLKKIEI